MNRIMNQYGVLKQGPVRTEAEKALWHYENTIRNIIQENGLNPIEIRCLESSLHPSVFAEEVLRGAFKLKKAEREVNFTLTPVQDREFPRPDTSHE